MQGQKGEPGPGSGAHPQALAMRGSQGHSQPGGISGGMGFRPKFLSLQGNGREVPRVWARAQGAVLSVRVTALQSPHPGP